MAEEAHDDLKKKEDVLPDPAQNPRNALIAKLAEEENQLKKDGVEVVDVADEDHDKTAPVPDDDASAHDQAPAAKFKIKVNGVEEEVTQEELIKRAEKASGADAQFQEAARLRKEAEELRAQPPVKDAAPTVDDDDRALARALQMGSEEEAAAVIKRIRSSGVKVNEVIGMMDLKAAGDWAKKEYPEIFSDSRMLKLFLEEDEVLVKQKGDKRTYQERYKSIGDGLRAWKGTQAQKIEQKVEAKRNLQVVPTATVRNAPPKEDDDEGPSNAEFIQAEAKRRGQQYVR